MNLMGSSVVVAVLLAVSLLQAPERGVQQCLPEGTELTHIVSTTLVIPGSGLEPKTITVEQKLIELKAECKQGKLLDGDGKQIRFYRLVGCWGNPPADYMEILAAQSSEIEKLKKRYTVIEMTCNPEGIQPH